jgi:DNA-binding transcriptional MerR regulator
MNHDEKNLLRIGELSRRVGLSEYVLRAWESRYGLLRPRRSSGGYRLYTVADQARVTAMQGYLREGLAAAEAAVAAIAQSEPTDTSEPDAAPAAGLGESAATLRGCLDDLDEPGAQMVLDRLLSDFTVESVLREVVLPYLHELGQRWVSGTVSIAQEHFASNVIRGRLSGLARGWGTGHGPYVILACPPGEQHDLPLMAFGVILNRCGWRVGYLGVNTPIQEVIAVTATSQVRLVVLAATTEERFAMVAGQLTKLGAAVPLALAGAGASAELADMVGARLMSGDPVTAAEQLASS